MNFWATIGLFYKMFFNCCTPHILYMYVIFRYATFSKQKLSIKMGIETKQQKATQTGRSSVYLWLYIYMYLFIYYCC